MDTSKVTRFEVIDHRLPSGITGVETGRIVTMHGCKVELSLQDDDRTLKVFVSGGRIPTGETTTRSRPIPLPDPLDPEGERRQPTKDQFGDYVCEHGTAMDVHCCHCHSGFIFDKDHECPEDQTMRLKTSTGVMLTVERYNDLLEGERGMWKTLKQWRDLVGALQKIRDTDADPKHIAAEACAADFDSIKLHEAYDGETRSLRTELAEAEAQIVALRAAALPRSPAPKMEK